MNDEGCCVVYSHAKINWTENENEMTVIEIKTGGVGVTLFQLVFPRLFCSQTCWSTAGNIVVG